MNVYDKFWGPCEVADPLIKRYLEFPDNSRKCEFISVDKEFTGEMFSKIKFTSLPKYFITFVRIIFNFQKGEIINSIEGIDFPKLMDSLEKSYPLLDESSQKLNTQIDMITCKFETEYR